MRNRTLINWNNLFEENKNEMKTINNTPELLGMVYQTNDYSIFKTIDGNRMDIENRSEKIKKSVEKVGYLPAPIIVNEKYEIIDGQARFDYCKNTNTPIAYYKIGGLGIDECIAMNISSSRWTRWDYINSYADRGNESYILLRDFIKQSKYRLLETLWVITRTSESNVKSNIENGELTITQQDIDSGKKILEYWENFDDIITNRKLTFLRAIGYCYLLDCVDNDLLIKKVHQRPKDFMMLSCLIDAIEVLENVYNFRSREHVYIKTEFLKYYDDHDRSNLKTSNRLKKVYEKNKAKAVYER